MITRQEISGAHFYDRETGFHCLLDEVKQERARSVLCGPRHLSVALSDECDCGCHYCYARHGTDHMTMELLWNVCSAAAQLQVLDLTLGGGEPTRHPSFVECVKMAWESFSFGVSVTSNGFDRLSLLKVAGCVSQIRLSVDPFKKALNAERSKTISTLAEQAPLAINMLLVADALDWAGTTLRQLQRMGVNEVLLIPHHDRGRFSFQDNDWIQARDLVKGMGPMRLSVSADASRHLGLPVLETAHPDEYMFAHVSTDGSVKMRSWGDVVGKAVSALDLVTALRRLHPLYAERSKDEDLG